MNNLNHFVLAARDLDALRQRYEAFGFKISSPGQHPFGTRNTIIQLQGNYIELLTVNDPTAVIEHTPSAFSFSAFNRDYLAAHEGFSMVVLGTEDAPADRERWAAEGLPLYDGFEFSRPAKMANGEDATIGFSLAFTSNNAAPWLGVFGCQHFNASFYQQPENQRHENSARAVTEVWVSGDGALGLKDYFATVLDRRAKITRPGLYEFETSTGKLLLSTAEEFESAFGERPLHSGDGPHLAGLTVSVDDISLVGRSEGKMIGNRLVMDVSKTFATFLAFEAV
jgi:hypothetical protein